MGTVNDPGLVSLIRGRTDYADSKEIASMVHRALDRLNLPDGWFPQGAKVVLKPNWVKEHDERQPGPNQWEHVVTHPAVIEGVADWVAPRLGDAGQMVICDAPQTDSSFAKLSAYLDLDGLLKRLRARWPKVTFRVLDLRPEEWLAVDGVTVSKTPLPGDPLGSTHARLNEESEFVGFSGLGQLYGASFDMAETNAKHQGDTHEYLLCRTPMEADVFINLPKLKTHKKVGLTCALKNLVGINAQKNWLPHHTEGAPEEGGDQFPQKTTKASLERSWMGAAKRFLKDKPGLSRVFVPIKKLARFYFGDTQKVVRSGNWHGNDTCWRMVLDLNKCLYRFDGSGIPRTNERKYLAVVDGIIAGEGNGPMAPDPVQSGAIIAGSNPLAVDTVAATYMGFDWSRIRLLYNAFRIGSAPFNEVRAESLRVADDAGAERSIEELPTLNFRPHFGWQGAIEKTTQSAEPRAQS